jgi:hypothetical protein
LSTADLISLTELEIWGLEVTSLAQIELMVQMVQQAMPHIRQVNLLGLHLSEELVLSSPGLFDGLVAAVEQVKTLDELQLRASPSGSGRVIVAADVPPLVSIKALEHLLRVKPKWWRFALDGMGLEDRHLHILAKALKSNKDCKMNDILSIQDNPNVTQKGLETLYTVCINKQRMGLVHCDDPSWVATFDLVRPLNNLHRRLEYMNHQDNTGGSLYTSRERWIEWLAVVGNLPWLEEERKLNYLWFALLEQPDFVQPPTLPPAIPTAKSIK